MSTNKNITGEIGLDGDLTEQQKKNLKKIADEILGVAKDMVKDYTENPSDVSGSVHPTEGKVKGVGVMVGMDSPYLDETKELDGNNVVEIRGDKDGSQEK
tara:strand:- start:144 stop:443 length:300 start_codon:yes stop_codon:yes gene_type:complete